MATTIGAALFEPMDEENPTSTAKEEEPPKKAEAAMATTTEVARVMPLEDKNVALVAEEAPKKVKAMMTDGEGEGKEHKKVVVGGQEEDVGLERKGGGFGSLEAKNDGAQGEGGEDDGGEVEEVEDAKGEISGVEESIKDDGGRGPAMQDREVVINVVKMAPTLESKLENSEFRVDDTALASPDALEGVDKGKLQEAWEEEEVGVVLEAKVVNKLVDDRNKKSEPGGDQEEEVGYKGRDMGELGEEKEVDHSVISVEVVEDKEVPFAKDNDELVYEKEINNDIVVVEGEETLKESTEKDGFEDEVAKTEPTNETSTVVVHDGSKKEVNPASEDYVLKYSLAEDQDVKGQEIASDVVDVVGAQKPLEVENIDLGVEDISVDEPTEIENVVATAEGVDVEKPVEVENVAACSGDSILSRELALELSKENNDPEKDQCATVVEHEEQVNDDCITKVMLDVTNAKNDEAKGYRGRDNGGKVEKEEEDAKGRSFRVVEAVKDDDNSELVAQHGEPGISVLQPAPVLTIQFKSKNSELGKDDASMASHDAPKGEDKGELCEEQEKVGVTIETNITDKYEDDAKAAVVEYEKLEQQGDKGEEVGYGGGDGGELGKENKAKVSVVSVEIAEPEDNIAILVEPNSELGYEKEETNDIVVMRDGEAPKELIETDVNFEDRATKIEPMREASTTVVHDGSIEEVDPESVDNVLEDSPGKEQNDEGHATRSETMKYVGVEKPLDVENFDDAMEDINVEKPTEVENIDVIVGVNVEKPTKVENIIASNVDGILSRELVPESSKENNDAEEVENAIEVVDHEDQVDDDGTFEAVTNVIEVENDEMEGDRGGDDGGELQEAIEDAEGGALGAVEAMKDDGRRELVVWEKEVDRSMIEPTPTLILEPKLDNGEFGEKEDTMASPDTLKGEDNFELWEEEVGMVVEAKVTEVVEKLEPEGEKSEKVGYGGGNGGELGKKNEDGIPVVIVVVAEQEDLLAPFAKAKRLLAFEKENNNDIVALGGDEATKESTKKNVGVEDDAAKLETTCKATIVVNSKSNFVANNVSPTRIVNNSIDAPIQVACARNVKEVDSTSADSMLEGSSGKEQNIEAVEDIGAEKPLEVKNIAVVIEDIGVEKATESENIVVVKGVNIETYVASKTSIVVVHDGSIKDVDLASDSVLKDIPRKEQNVEGLATSSEAMEDVGLEKHLEVENIAATIEDISVEKSKNIKHVVDVKPVPASNMIIVIMDDGSEVDLASEDNVLEDSPWKEQDAEGLVNTSEVVEDVSIKKYLEVENIAAAVEDIGVDKPTKIEDIVALEVVDVKLAIPTSKVVYGGSIKEVDLASVDIMLKDSPHNEQNTEVLAIASEVMAPLEVDNDVVSIEDIGAEKPTEIQNVVAVEHTSFKLEPVSEVVYDGSVKEVDPASANRVLEDSPCKKQNVEGLVTASEMVEDVGIEKPLEVENIAIEVDDIGVEKSIEIENVAAVEDVDVNHEPAREASIVIIYDGSINEVDLPSGDSVLKDNPWKEKDAEGLASTSEVVEDFSVEKPLEVENIVAAIEHIGVVKLEPASEASIVVLHDGSIKEVDLASGDSVLKDSPWKEQDTEGLARVSEVVEDFGVKKPLEVENIASTLEDIGVVKPTEIENIIPIEGVDVKSESASETSIAIVHDGSVKEVDPTTGDNMLKDSPWKEQNVEGLASASEAVEDFGLEKHLEGENIVVAIEDIGVVNPTEIENIVAIDGIDVKFVSTSEASIVPVHDGSAKEVCPTSVDTVLEDSPWKEEDVEGLASASEVVEDFGVNKPLEVENIAAVVGDIGVVKPIEIENVIHVEGVDVKPESVSEMTIVIVHDGSIKEIDPSSVDRMLEDSPWKEQNVEGLVTASEVVGDVGVEKPSEVKIIATTEEDTGVEKSIEIENVEAVEGIDVKPEPASEPRIGIVHDGSTKEVDLASEDNVLNSSPWKEQDAKGLVSASEVMEDFGVEKHLEVENIVATIGDIGVVKPTEIKNVIPIEGVDDKLQSTSDVSIVLVHDGSVKEVDPASANRVLEDSPCKKQNVEGLVTASEVVGDVGIEKPLEVENIAIDIDDIGVEKSIEIENVAAAEDVDVNPEPAREASIVIMYDGSVKEVDLASGDSVLKGSSWKERDVDGLASTSEVVEDFGVEKPLEVENIAAAIEDIGVVKFEPASEASIVVLPDGSIKEVDLASGDSVLKDSPWKEQDAEGLASVSEVVENFSVEKPLEVENIASTLEDIGVVQPIEIEYIIPIEGVDIKFQSTSEIVHDGSVKEVDPTSGDNMLQDSSWKEQNAKGLASASEAVEDFGAEKPLEVENIADVVEDIVVKPTKIEDVTLVEGINVKPELVSEVVHDGIVKEFDPVSAESVLEDSHGKEQNAEGLATTSEVMEDDGDDNGDKGFYYATLAPTGGPSYENIIFSSQDDPRILNMDWAACLGSSTPSLRPTAPHQPAGSNLFNTSELALTADPTEETAEEEKKLHDKVELIRVKFMRLVYRLGATLEETVAAQVLYRLSLAEGIIHGRQTNQAFSLDSTRKKALILEAEGKEHLNFSCNILVLGKTGVGKSATINSIFGEEKLKTDAFSLATTSMREIVGDVHGVKIRIIDTPGLRPSVMDQGSNRKILVGVKKYIKKCPPDIVLYVDRLDCLSRDLSDLPLLKTITAVLGSSIWFDAIVALTHAASTPEGLNGAPMTYDVIMAQSSHIIQQSIRQAAGDMRLMNPVTLVENHPSCRRNSEGQKVLPNGQSWRHQMLLMCYSSKILSEANSLLKFHDPNNEDHFGFHFDSMALHFLLTSLLQSRAHPKLLVEHGGNEGNSDIELNDYSNVEQADDEEQYDHLPPLPDMVLPPSFDCDNPTYRYRFLEPTSSIQARPVLDAHGWDHDCGYDGISVEETLAILNRFPVNVAVQATKNKKEFSIHLDSSIAAKHGENASSLAGFDIQTVGRQLVYILRGETKIKNIKKNRTTGGFLVTFLADTLATGLKVEDQLSLGKRLSLVARTGAMRVQGDTAYGANLEAHLKDRECPISRSLSTQGLSLMKWHQNLALGANLQSQFSIGMGSKMALHLGLNNKLNGQITVKTSTSEHVQIALLGLMPVAASIYKSFRPSKP